MTKKKRNLFKIRQMKHIAIKKTQERMAGTGPLATNGKGNRENEKKDAEGAKQ